LSVDFRRQKFKSCLAGLGEQQFWLGKRCPKWTQMHGPKMPPYENS
jgi:cytochrome c peroxidase